MAAEPTHSSDTGTDGWAAEAERIEQLRGDALAMGGPEKVARQHARGKLTVRERLDELLDPGSFDEIGILADHQNLRPDLRGMYAAADGIVTGAATIDGRPVFISAEDFTVFGGSTGKTGLLKRARVCELALKERIPFVYLLDGAGARAQESIIGGWNRNERILPQASASGVIPQVACVTGPVAGYPAVEASVGDFRIMLRDTGMVAAAGPPLVKASLGQDVTLDELGGYKVHTEQSGTIDNVAATEHELFAQVRRYLAYMPQNCFALPPRVESKDDPFRREEELLSIVPRRSARAYDMQRIIAAIVDRDSFFEIQPRYGRALITGLARFDGDVVGIVANQPKHHAGAFSGPEAEKALHFLQLCNSFNIPLVFLTDVPGFMIGPAAEREGTLRRGVRVAFLLAQTRVPTITVIIRKTYGMGAMVMNVVPAEQTAILSWPSIELGSLPVRGGVDAGFKQAIADAEDPTALREEVEARYRGMNSAVDSAKTFKFDDLIDPRETRPRIVRVLRRLRASRTAPTTPWERRGILP